MPTVVSWLTAFSDTANFGAGKSVGKTVVAGGVRNAAIVLPASGDGTGGFGLGIAGGCNAVSRKTGDSLAGILRSQNWICLRAAWLSLVNVRPPIFFVASIQTSRPSASIRSERLKVNQQCTASVTRIVEKTSKQRPLSE